jgi:hypothetical protein
VAVVEGKVRNETGFFIEAIGSYEGAFVLSFVNEATLCAQA